MPTLLTLRERRPNGDNLETNVGETSPTHSALDDPIPYLRPCPNPKIASQRPRAVLEDLDILETGVESGVVLTGRCCEGARNECGQRGGREQGTVEKERTEGMEAVCGYHNQPPRPQQRGERMEAEQLTVERARSEEDKTRENDKRARSEEDETKENKTRENKAREDEAR
ncbi:hypothetical protein FA13DRAFT_1713834 [Coprinellus micaceus]|uniref:Uncharacterized protein n=1 Tax=Coprinellus micaceus TaxID=71717 RepID=A0A4Y7SWH0_COPMI|nr:hypothetical protein FA13DRAFT_1713834 [Coprinellus micaceus]